MAQSTAAPPHHHPDPIEVDGLVKRFGALRAVDGLTLTIRPGTIHGFLGPNGAGKSTTLRVLLGMYRRDAGRVRVLGADPAHDSTRINRRTAYVPGDVALWPALSGAQTLDAVAALRGSRDRGREAELIEAFSLDPSKAVRSYSKGNRQKVALVAALAAPVDLLLLDEPNSGLDPLQQEVFEAAVLAAAGQGRTVLLSSHVLSEVDRLCSEVTIIKDGRTVESGSLADLRHLRSSTITFRLPEDAVASATAPSVAVASATAPSGVVTPATAPSGVLPPGVVPLSSATGAVPQIEADGSLSLSVAGEDVPAALRELIERGARDLTCTRASLEELFLRHYEVEAR